MAATGFDVRQLIGPMLISAVLKGQDIGPIIDALVESQINKAITTQLLTQMQIPPEWKPLVDTLVTLSDLETLRAVMAAMRGERYEPAITTDKIIELIVTLQMVSALTQALGGGTATTQATAQQVAATA